MTTPHNIEQDITQKVLQQQLETAVDKIASSGKNYGAVAKHLEAEGITGNRLSEETCPLAEAFTELCGLKETDYQIRVKRSVVHIRPKNGGEVLARVKLPWNLRNLIDKFDMAWLPNLIRLPLPPEQQICRCDTCQTVRGYTEEAN